MDEKSVTSWKYILQWYQPNRKIQKVLVVILFMFLAKLWFLIDCSCLIVAILHQASWI